MNLESPKVNVKKNQTEMYNFLTQVENYKQLMPESMEKFEVTAPDSFLFALKGMPQIELKIQETHEPDLVVLGSTSEKFDFNLNAIIEADGDNGSDVKLLFDGKFNSMMAMMVKSPLTKFITTLSENIAKV
jgi:putative sterol carrier protein